MRAVRSKQLTRRAFWADPTIHYLGQVAVESREGIEELTIDQARILGGPDRRPGQGENVEFVDITAQKDHRYCWESLDKFERNSFDSETL